MNFLFNLNKFFLDKTDKHHINQERENELKINCPVRMPLPSDTGFE